MSTCGHPGPLQNMRDVYVWTHLDILGTHKTNQELHMCAHVGIRVAIFVFVGHPWAPPWAP